MPGKIIDEKSIYCAICFDSKTQSCNLRQMYICPCLLCQDYSLCFFLSANNAYENNKQAREMDHSWTADN